MNNKTMPISSNNEWLQHYNQHQAMSPVDEQPSSLELEGAPPAMTTKPIRRRSRASKKTPTTLLNANANNFRELVQQFTGCPSADPLSNLANRKGPVNLNFCLKNATPLVESPRNYGDYRPHYSQPHPQQQQQSDFFQSNTIGQDDQQKNSRMYSSTSLNTCMNNISDYHSFNNINTIEISNGFVMDDYDLSINDYAPLTEY